MARFYNRDQSFLFLPESFIFFSRVSLNLAMCFLLFVFPGLFNISQTLDGSWLMAQLWGCSLAENKYIFWVNNLLNDWMYNEVVKSRNDSVSVYASISLSLSVFVYVSLSVSLFLSLSHSFSFFLSFFLFSCRKLLDKIRNVFSVNATNQSLFVWVGVKSLEIYHSLWPVVKLNNELGNQ